MGVSTETDALRDVSFPPQDEPLREDVRRLGALVGEMLAEQCGEAFFERVEAVRTAAIRRREGGEDSAALTRQFDGLDVRESEALARAFAAYFQVVNLAERVHRIRRRRDYQLVGAAPQPESLADVFATLKARGVGAEELMAWLERLDVEPVFTAHPTEAVRRSLLEKEQTIVRALVDDFDPARTPRERAVGRERMRDAITTSWQTAEAARVRPGVQDEFEHVGFYLSDPIYRVLPVFYETLQGALERIYGITPKLVRVLRFGSWVGGDMDGNPNVGADTIKETLRAQRDLVLRRYLAECGQLARLLSQTDDRVTVSDALLQRLDDYGRSMPEAAAAIRPRHADMPYRCLLTLMRARLVATSADAAGAYRNAREFADDVSLIENSLAAHKGAHAGLFAVRRLGWRACSFGFHLARLDVRQDARAHDDVLALLLDDADWPSRDPARRSEVLRPCASGERQFNRHDDPSVERLRAVFATLAEAQRGHDGDAIGPYIISMARSAADVLAVLALARYGSLVEIASSGRRAGRPDRAHELVDVARSTVAASAAVVGGPEGPTKTPSMAKSSVVAASAAPANKADDTMVPLDIAPLFETVDDLQHGAATLRAMLADPVYRAHLAGRGDRQWIMLGYSDSAKYGGILAARWALQRAQVELLDVAKQAGIALAFFHGRGGSASRGGARITPALMASPRGAVAGRLRITEQGEVIHRKYGIRALALRNLEQMVGAVLRASLRPREPEPREAIWRERMEKLAGYSRERYRDLVNASDFVDYFLDATPIDVIERMTIGSRPASRRAMRGIEDLRAIPWVFAWTQCRAIMTGWYGLGTALERGVGEFGEDAMAEMARDWPFLSTLLDDVEMVLAKADMDIAEAFSRLSGDHHARFFPDLRGEFTRTRDWLLRLKGRDRLLADDRRLAQSIRLRNPYVDPMSLLQLDLLQRWRESGRRDDALLRALVSCVNGVSRGLQNTG